MCPPDSAMTEYQHAILSPDKKMLVSLIISFATLFTSYFFAVIICLYYYNLSFSSHLGFWDCTTGPWCPVWIMLWGIAGFGHPTIFFFQYLWFQFYGSPNRYDPACFIPSLICCMIAPYLFFYWLDLILNQVHCRWSLKASSESSCILDIKVGKFLLGYGFSFSWKCSIHYSFATFCLLKIISGSWFLVHWLFVIYFDNRYFLEIDQDLEYLSKLLRL